MKATNATFIAELLGPKKLVEISKDHLTQYMTDERSSNILSYMNKQPCIAKDTYTSDSTFSQDEVESQIRSIYEKLSSNNILGHQDIILNKGLHVKYVLNSLQRKLPSYFAALDANHGWMLYWLINSYLIMENSLPDQNITKLISNKIFYNTISDGFGGIAGGKNQIGHLAATYASILALADIGDFETLKSLRKGIYAWFLSLKNHDGSFSMHVGGEADTRSTYCVLAVATILNIRTDELTANTLDWICSCQTYEGGFSAVPYSEAHGGYTFCSLASILLLLSFKDPFVESIRNMIDVDSLLRWTCNRQYQLEGGFSGRTNKLVDACYSFWIGGTMSMLEILLEEESLFDRDLLRCYILNCCQDNANGGLKDKPGKHVDFYHTNYALCGLSIAENSYFISKKTNFGSSIAYNIDAASLKGGSKLAAVHPIFGIPITSVLQLKEQI